MKSHREGREMLFDFRSGQMMNALVYYEYVPGRVGTYRAELEIVPSEKRIVATGITYEEALERLQRRLGEAS